MTITVNAVAEAWRKVSDTENRVIYSRPAHSLQEKRLVQFSVILPTRRGSDLGVIKPRIRVLNGDVDADGTPRIRDTLASVEFSVPVANDSAVAMDVLNVLEALTADPNILPDMFKGLLPQSNLI